MLTKSVPTEALQTAVNRMDDKEEQSAKIIRKYSLIAAGAALIPYDFVDLISTTVAQTLLVREMCQLYDIPYSDKMFNVAFWSATGSVAVKAVTTVVGNVLEGMDHQKNEQIDITGAAVAGIYTAAVGEFYKLHLRDGGTLDDIQVADFAEYFIDEIKRGDLSLATFTDPRTLLGHLGLKS